MSERWLQTYTGQVFDLLEISNSQICIEDIAHALAMKCRFNGHCTTFYSVAQHSIHVSLLLPPELQIHGLLHDAAEAYLPDVCRPIKQLLRFDDFNRTLRPYGGTADAKEVTTSFYVVEDYVLKRMIYPSLGLESDMSTAQRDALKQADDIMLMTECRDLMAKPPKPWALVCPVLPGRIIAMEWDVAERSFIERYNELTKRA